MIKTERKKLYCKTFEKWGFNLQMGMLMEECAELIQATHKIIRLSNYNREKWERLIEELADVEIMIEQIKLGLDGHNLEYRVEKVKNNKLKRLKEMLGVDEE